MSNYYNRQWRLPNAWNGTESNVNKQSNYSMYIDVGGSSSHIDTNYYLPSGTNPKSISFWLKNVDPNGWVTTGYQYTVHGGALSTGEGFGIGIIGSSNGTYIWFIGHGAGDYFIPSSATGTMTTNVWYHIVVTYENTRTNNLHFYLDGVKIDETNESLNTSSANSVKIGASATGGGGSGAQYVYVDGVSIYNYALSSSQITTLYGSSSTGIGNPMSLSPKPVAYYPLGDQDSFNGSNYLVPNIAAQEADGDIATSYSPYALSFDGTDDYINCGNDSSLVPNSLTISLWFKTSGSASAIPRLINKSYGGSPYDSYFIRINNGVLNFKIGVSSASVQIAGTTNVVDGNWHNVIGTYDGSQLNLYLDGNSEATPVSETRAITENTSYNLTLGCEFGAYGFSWPFTGSLSNVSIWNAALTSTQVTEIYSEGVPSNLNNHSAYSNLVSWWQLGSNSSFNTNWTVLDEVTASGNNGVSANMTEADIVDGVNSYANGVSSGMSDNIVGDAPYSSSNSLSVNMDALDRVEDTPS